MLITIRNENIKIKKSLKDYDRYSTPKAYFNINTTASYENLNNRFKQLAGNINFILKNGGAIKDIKRYERLLVTLNPANSKQFKIFSKGKNIPLIVLINVDRGVGGGRIMFSQEEVRPRLEDCDKAIYINSKNMTIAYSPSKEKGYYFIGENIHITVEAIDIISITFQCVFGFGNCFI